MNRQQEYNDFMLELDKVPTSMTQMSAKTKTRAKKRKIIRFATMPSGVLVALLFMITVSVNIFPTVAYAFERVPVLRQIAAAVNFSPSLRDALEHEFIQPIGLEQTIGDITMRVEYVIVDQRQLNIFYTLNSPVYSYLNSWRSSIRCDVEGTHLPVTIFTASHTLETSNIRQMTVNYASEQMPSRMVFELEVVPIDMAEMTMPVPAPASPITEWERTEPENITSFTFTLEFDPDFTQQGETLYVNQDFMVDGQIFTLTTVEIYPTHMRANFSADPANTVWLRSLRFHAENELGNRFDTISNGITAFSATDSPMMVSHFLHSPFFAESNELKIYISQVEWLNKDGMRARIDLENGIVSQLPEGVALDDARWDGQSWHLSFAVEERKENHSHQVFGSDYFNEYGDEFWITSWSSGIRFHETTTSHSPGIFFVQFSLLDFPYDIVYLTPSYTRLIKLYEPIVLRVR